MQPKSRGLSKFRSRTQGATGLFSTRFQATGHGIHRNVIAEPVTWKSPGISLPGSLRHSVEGLGARGRRHRLGPEPKAPRIAFTGRRRK